MPAGQHTVTTEPTQGPPASLGPAGTAGPAHQADTGQPLSLALCPRAQALEGEAHRVGLNPWAWAYLGTCAQEALWAVGLVSSAPAPHPHGRSCPAVRRSPGGRGQGGRSAGPPPLCQADPTPELAHASSWALPCCPVRGPLSPTLGAPGRDVIGGFSGPPATARSWTCCSSEELWRRAGPHSPGPVTQKPSGPRPPTPGHAPCLSEAEAQTGSGQPAPAPPAAEPW